MVAVLPIEAASHDEQLAWTCACITDPCPREAQSGKAAHWYASLTAPGSDKCTPAKQLDLHKAHETKVAPD